MKDKCVMKRLQARRLPHGDPTVERRMNPFREIAMHLSKNRVRRFVRVEPSPLVLSRAVPQLGRQRIASGAGLYGLYDFFSARLDAFRVMVVQSIVVANPLAARRQQWAVVVETHQLLIFGIAAGTL